MRLGGARRGAGAGGTLDRTEIESSSFCNAFKPRQYITCRAHISWFFLNPNDLTRVGMLLDGSGDFRAQQRVELVQKENGGVGVCTEAAVRVLHLAGLSSVL